MNKNNCGPIYAPKPLMPWYNILAVLMPDPLDGVKDCPNITNLGKMVVAILPWPVWDGCRGCNRMGVPSRRVREFSRRRFHDISKHNKMRNSEVCRPTVTNHG
mmetsp:Transcript_36917/g.76771  ORF Transcript_36917/g.76771 Transcript_36917/m.76771 type:complete len:103 (+) Transcript_36917:34-342(+)